MGACLLGLAAGALSSLSPCVLPLLPVALAGALERHRLGPLALAAGVAASATAFGLVVAMLGLALDRDLVRVVAAGVLVIAGVGLLGSRIEGVFSRGAAPLAAWASARLGALSPRGLAGQIAVGALLGVLWTPCGGPTLAAATTLASQRESLWSAAAVMGAYSAGAALPLLLLGYGARRALAAPERLARIARAGAPIVGSALVLTGTLALTGVDRAIETGLVERLPSWLVELTTTY